MIGFTFTDPDVNIPAEVTHVRLWDVGVAWKDLHTGPGVFNWKPLDDAIARAGSRHITYVVGATPRWLARNPDSPHAAPWLGPGSNSMPWSMTHAMDFLRTLSRRYKGRIHAYEMWNEPQLVDFLYPWDTATRAALGTFTRWGYDTIKQNDPAALVLSGAILPRPSSGGVKRARKYLDVLASRDWPVDGFTTHIYPEVGTGVERWQELLGQVRKVIADSGAKTRRLWVTETTFGLLSPSPLPEHTAPDLVAGLYEAAGKSAVWWYGWERPDIRGLRITPDSTAWESIKREAA